MTDRAIRLIVEVVFDDARDFVLLVRDDRVLAELGERQIREYCTRGNTLDRIARRHTGEVVATLRRIRLREHFLDRGEAVTNASDRRRELHRGQHKKTPPIVHWIRGSISRRAAGWKL